MRNVIERYLAVVNELRAKRLSDSRLPAKVEASFTARLDALWERMSNAERDQVEEHLLSLDVVTGPESPESVAEEPATRKSG